MARHILILASRLWRDETDRPWLSVVPIIQMQRHPHRRQPYPLSVAEQCLLFSELAAHLASMAHFKVNTGTREHRAFELSSAHPSMRGAEHILHRRQSLSAGYHSLATGRC